MEKLNTLFKPIILVFSIIVFGWLVQVTRYEYIQIPRTVNTTRIDRLTGEVELYSYSEGTWNPYQKSILDEYEQLLK
jgi:hypothetical protein